MEKKYFKFFVTNLMVLRLIHESDRKEVRP